MVRRSARLRGNTPSSEEAKPSPAAMAKLSSLMERDETPEVGSQPNIETVLSTPATRSVHGTPAASSRTKSPFARTPTTTGNVRPSHEEMHPSKARPSTTKQPDTGLILGFNPVKRDSNGNIIKQGIIESTPTKTKGSPPSDLGTPAFDFKFSCHDSQLSNEARKLMENVREDVARIKAKMILDKREQTRKENVAEDLQEGRKIAKPKGRAGRFSDAHMTQFKKMDSIAGHPSAFRATPGRFQPVNKSLKRTSSKACLDGTEKGQSPSKPTATPSRIAGAPELATRKRIKKSESDDTSTRRPITGEDESRKSTKSVNPRPKTFIRSSLMTPTKAFSSRSASAKPSKTSTLPLAHSPLSKAAATPRTPQTEFNPRLKSNLPSLGNLKSILRCRQPLFSNDPVKIAAGTHIASPDFNPDIQLNNLPSISFGDPNQTPSPKKRVEFTPSTKSRHDLAQASPSPSKIPAPSARTAGSDVVYPTLPVTTPEKEKKDAKSSPAKVNSPTIRHVREHGASSTASAFANLPAVPHGIINKKRHRDEVDDDNDVENIPPTGSSSDERSIKRVKTNPAQLKIATPSPVKGRSMKSATPARGTPGRLGTPGSIRQRSKGVLSLSRLNMLAKPKGHR